MARHVRQDSESSRLFFHEVRSNQGRCRVKAKIKLTIFREVTSPVAQR